MTRSVPFPMFLPAIHNSTTFSLTLTENVNDVNQKTLMKTRLDYLSTRVSVLEHKRRTEVVNILIDCNKDRDRRSIAIYMYTFYTYNIYILYISYSSGL